MCIYSTKYYVLCVAIEAWKGRSYFIPIKVCLKNHNTLQIKTFFFLLFKKKLISSNTLYFVCTYPSRTHIFYDERVNLLESEFVSYLITFDGHLQTVGRIILDICSSWKVDLLKTKQNQCFQSILSQFSIYIVYT